MLVSAAVATDTPFVWPVQARMLAARLPGGAGAALLEATLAPSEFLSCQARSAPASCGDSAIVMDRKVPPTTSKPIPQGVLEHANDLVVCGAIPPQIVYSDLLIVSAMYLICNTSVKGC